MSVADSSSLSGDEEIKRVHETVIEPNGDFWIIARDFEGHAQNLGDSVKGYVEEKFQVSQKRLEAKSNFFKAKFSHKFSDFKNATAPTLLETRRDALRVVLEVLHNSISPRSYETGLKDLWLMISICDEIQVDHKILATWFRDWYNKNVRNISKLHELFVNKDEFWSASSLLFPCCAFGHKKAFMQVTRHLVYATAGPVREVNPTTQTHLKTPPRIVRK